MPISGSNSKGKSGGLRILWLPGKRKHHPKGRFDATNKQVSFNNTGQRHKNNVWSLGGNKTHRNLLEADDTNGNLFDGPSVSGLALATCTTTNTLAKETKKTEKGEEITEEQHLLSSNNTSTATLISATGSPTTIDTTVEIVNHRSTEDNDSTKEMPGATAHAMHATPQAVIVRTTTTAEIFDENRFSILDKPNHNEMFDVYDLPLPPGAKIRSELEKGPEMEMKLLNTSTGTNTDSISSTSPSLSPKKDNLSNSSSSTLSNKRRKNGQRTNQADVNSIESVSDSTYPTLAVGSKAANTLEVDWIDDLIQDRNDKKGTPTTQNNHNKLQQFEQQPQHKSSKKNKKSKERDQLDGVTLRATKNGTTKNNQPEEKEADDDDKVVKCLYYTLMCCDCTIC